MKLSRRGKQVKRTRRGKHTKRAGKHLRYKGKKVRASKRYHRAHKRTYKRGRRFQHGGFVIKWGKNNENQIIGQSFTLDDVVVEDELNKGIFELTYKKKLYPTSATSKFNMRVFINNDTKKLDKIVFVRYDKSDNPDMIFDIKDIDMLTNPNLLKVWKSDAGSTYDFNYSSNTDILTTYAETIKNTIEALTPVTPTA